MRSVSIVATGLLAMVLAAYAESGSPSLSGDPKSYSDALIAWAGRLESFDGAYDVHVIDHRATAKAPERSYRVAYKFDEYGNRWMSTNGAFDNASYTEALYSGKSGYRLERKRNRPDGVEGEVNLGSPEGWKWPRGDFMLPDEVLRSPISKLSFRELLREGNTTLDIRDGEEYLAFAAQSGSNVPSFNCFFFPDGNVSMLEECHRFGESEDERKGLAASLGVTIGELAIMWSRFEYANYLEIDGVLIPTTIRRTRYISPSHAEAKKEFAAKRISFEEYVGRTVLGPESRAVNTIDEVKIDLAATRLNRDLNAEDFEIPYGKGDLFGTYGNDEVVHLQSWYQNFYAWCKEPKNLVMMLSLLGVCLFGSRVVYLRLRAST